MPHQKEPQQQSVLNRLSLSLRLTLLCSVQCSQKNGCFVIINLHLFCSNTNVFFGEHLFLFKNEVYLVVLIVQK